jgi:hypothetical protein
MRLAMMRAHLPGVHRQLAVNRLGGAAVRGVSARALAPVKPGGAALCLGRAACAGSLLPCAPTAECRQPAPSQVTSLY